MSDLARPRFYVIATTGFGLSTGHTYPPRTSYAVLDRLKCHREVYKDYVRVRGGGGLPDPVRRSRAEAKADELNRKHAA